MELSEILRYVDHTLLSQTATRSEISALCDEGIKYNTASVCIPPCYVAFAKEYTGGKIRICTVTGFPNGYSTTASKVFESADAVKNGADEIDTVINIGFLKDKRFDEVQRELSEIKKACEGRLLKVIIETCLLEREEKIRMCDIVTNVGADYIKTSTGFSTAGAKLEDIKLFAENVGENVKIKAAGGIKTIDDAEAFIAAGASRLGTSRIVALAKTLSI